MHPPVVLLALALFSAAPFGSAEEPLDPGVTLEWAERFERMLDLDAELRNDPSYEGPLSLESYARYYEAQVIDGARFVRAVYAPPLERHPEDWKTCAYRDGAMTDCRPVEQPSDELLRARGRGIHIDEPAPDIEDGGCGVVTLWIQPKTLRIAEARCNGLA